jgi:protein arginine N-methyltransferase 1
MFPADVIPLQYQALLLDDERRMTAFETAIARTVTPGMRVLDLGAGTGVLSCFAARQGALVTAVEWEPRVFDAARSALRVAVGDAVRLVHADARDYLPDELVDLVICEMLHVGLLRERQIEVIDRFKQRYPGPMPRFLPAACVQAVQPVQHDFTYAGYVVPAPVFQHPDCRQPRTVEAAAPAVFQQFFYSDPLPSRCAADLRFVATRRAEVNAVRVITKNLLADGVDWLMNYLVVPLTDPVSAGPGEEIRVRFSYRPGDEIPALTDGLTATTTGRAPVAGHVTTTGHVTVSGGA